MDDPGFSATLNTPAHLSLIAYSICAVDDPRQAELKKRPVCLTRKMIALPLEAFAGVKQIKFRIDASCVACVDRCGLVATATLIAMVATIVNPDPSWTDPDAFTPNRLLGRGMNLGNALDSPF
jgi:hypothetical protein